MTWTDWIEFVRISVLVVVAFVGTWFLLVGLVALIEWFHDMWINWQNYQ